MSVTRTITPWFNPAKPAKPAISAEHRTKELSILTPRSGTYTLTAIREVQFKDEDGTVVEAPPGEVPQYQFTLAVTPELLATEPELASVVAWIAAFLDRHDPRVP